MIDGKMIKEKDQSDEMNGGFQTVKILGSRIHIVDINDITSSMVKWIEEYNPSKSCRQIVNTGFHGTWEAYKDPELKVIMNSADLWIPDGIAFTLIAHKKGFVSFKRLAGVDFMKAFFELADRKGYKSFFYGDTDETLTALKVKLEEKYPGHKIAGMFSPPFRLLSPEEDKEIVRVINDAGPDVLWVGLGCPKQDRWIFEHKDKLKVPMAAGVGATFSFFAEKVKRSPEWVEKSGFEWLWRFIQEPKKLWRRDLIEGPRFLFHVALELTGLRKYE